jgi:hypothetical protein
MKHASRADSDAAKQSALMDCEFLLQLHLLKHHLQRQMLFLVAVAATEYCKSVRLRPSIVTYSCEERHLQLIVADKI